MTDLFSTAGRAALAQFAWSRMVLALDFDGTLAPIVSDPAKAIMRARTRHLLRRAAALYPCVVLSGRAQRDVSSRLRGCGLRTIVGNHGLAPGQAQRPFITLVRRWKRQLTALLALPGIVLEDKGASLAVHYRRSRQKKVARAAILEAARSLGELRVIPGKQVVNLMPIGAPHKGVALERERARLGCDTAVYVGDDDSDEDVFALDQPGQLLTIRVGAKRSSLAAYSLENQRAIDGLLRMLIEARSRVSRSLG